MHSHWKRAGEMLIVALALLAGPLGATAQQPAKVPRVGYLGSSSPAVDADLIGAFRQGLRDLGYIEGQNLVIEYRWAEGRYERLPEFAAELVRLKVDVLLTAGTPGALAAKRATPTIPIVMVRVGDPVAYGLVASLARPGANLTGLSTDSTEVDGKRLELLKEILPSLSRVGVLLNPANPNTALHWKQVQAAAEALHLKLERVEVKRAEDFDAAFAALARQRPRAFLMLGDLFLFAHRARIVTFATRQRLPAMYPTREFVDAGGLISYAASSSDMYRRAATYVDKILKGAKPADLPVEQPTRFELVVNMKTAKALGLTIPPSVLVRADQVIQ